MRVAERLALIEEPLHVRLSLVFIQAATLPYVLRRAVQELLRALRHHAEPVRAPLLLLLSSAELRRLVELLLLLITPRERRRLLCTGGGIPQTKLDCELLPASLEVLRGARLQAPPGSAAGIRFVSTLLHEVLLGRGHHQDAFGQSLLAGLSLVS